MFTYDPYRNMLKRRDIKQQELIKDKTINARIANQLKHDKSVTIETLDKICKRLDCQFNDLIRHIDE